MSTTSQSRSRDGRVRRLAPHVLALSLAGLAVGGVASAAIPAQDGVITGCYLKSGGTLRVIDADTTRCRSGETQLTWGQTGPQGPAGADGVNGADGKDGANGVSGWETVVKDIAITTPVFGSTTAECPAGKKVTGGGAYALDGTTPIGASSVTILASGPLADGTGWLANYEVTSTFGIDTVRITAICATVG